MRLHRRSVALLVSIVVGYFTAQAVFWPWWFSNSEEVAWWQSKLAAEIGVYVGIPLWQVIARLPATEDRALAEVLHWLSVLVYAAFVYLVVSLLLKRLSRRGN